MPNYFYYCAPLGGLKIINVLVEVWLESFDGRKVQFQCQSNVGIFDLTIKQFTGDNIRADFERVQTAFSERAGAIVEETTIRTNLDGSDCFLRYRRNDERGWHFELGHPSADPIEAIKFYDRLANKVNLLPRREAAQSWLVADDRHFLKTAQDIVAEFSSCSAKLTQEAARQSVEISKQINAKTTELDERFLLRQQELEDRYVAKQQDLEKKQEEHAKSVAEFDLRSTTAVRRDLLKEIRSMITQQRAIEITKGTINKRFPITVACIAGMLFGLSLAGVFVQKLLAASSFDWHYAIPVSAGTALFVSTMIYFIRWNDQWFRDHARAEFANRKFSTDILRASWLAELYFEWESKREQTLPPEILQSFTRGLFVIEEHKGTNHPFDDLTSFMKQFSTVKLGKTGLEVSTGKSNKTSEP